MRSHGDLSSVMAEAQSSRAPGLLDLAQGYVSAEVS